MPTPPNIILILIDDLGIRDLGCEGSSFYETRHIDALAAAGARARQGYAASPVCSPTRAAIMTGKSPARLAMTQIIPAKREGRLRNVPFLHHLPHQEISLARALSSQGNYQTWHVGKWHLGGEGYLPQDHGFDINVAGCHWGAPGHGFFAPWKLPGLSESPEGTHLTDRLTDEAISLIENRDPRRPFFLNLCHYSVHEPIEAPESYVNDYRRKASRLGLDQIDPIVTGEPIRFEHPEPYRVMRRQVQSMPEYGAMVHHLDDNIGRLLAALDQCGLADNTLVIFTSDNGGVGSHSYKPPFTCNHPWAEGKGWCEEGGMRVPYLFRWPGVIPPGSILHPPVTSMDLYPTCLQAAGIPLRPKQHADGIGLLDCLKDPESTLDRPYLCFHYPHYSRQGGCPASAIVQGRWKLVWTYEDGARRLYDLGSDPSETQDLSSSSSAKANELSNALRHWLSDTEARFPQPNPQHPDRASDPVS